MTNQTGTIIHDGEKSAIRFERRLPFGIEAVWAAITEPDQRAKWLGPTTLEPRRGGTIKTIAEGPPAPPEMRQIEGRILVWDPPRVLEHEWQQSIIGMTVIRYELTRDGGGTVLKLTHTLLPPRSAEGFIPGTHAYLDRLEAHLGATELPNWERRYAELKASYA